MKKLFLFLCIAAMLGGCTIAKISGRGAVPMMLNQPNEKVNTAGHYTAQKSISFDYTNAFDVSEIISRDRSLTDAEKIINVSITIKTTPGNFFINLFTLGLANSRTVVVDYDLVKK